MTNKPINYLSMSEKINLKESKNVSYWADEFNLRVEELVEIVKLVGPLVHDVRMVIAKRLLLAWPVSY